MRSAIIDNGIDIETLSNYTNKTKSFMVCHEKVISCEPPQYITHGGACAKVFASQAGMLPDISICLNRDSADMSNASDLANALVWCANNGVDLISLSMGTTCFGDVPILRDALNKLQNAGTIVVAAFSNDMRITFPAAFPYCIGVCHSHLLEKGKMLYIEQSFDGVDVVTNLTSSGSNSHENAFIAGVISNAFDDATHISDIRSWLAEFSIKYPNAWKETYLREKIVHDEEHEAIIIACCAVSTRSVLDFLIQLQKIINSEGYTCAILLKKGKGILSQYWFSLEESGLSELETLALVDKLCHPDVIIHDLSELACSADVLVYGDKMLPTQALLSLCYKNTVPSNLWTATKKMFE